MSCINTLDGCTILSQRQTYWTLDILDGWSEYYLSLSGTKWTDGQKLIHHSFTYNGLLLVTLDSFPSLIQSQSIQLSQLQIQWIVDQNIVLLPIPNTRSMYMQLSQLQIHWMVTLVPMDTPAPFPDIPDPRTPPISPAAAPHSYSKHIFLTFLYSSFSIHKGGLLTHNSVF